MVLFWDIQLKRCWHSDQIFYTTENLYSDSLYMDQLVPNKNSQSEKNGREHDYHRYKI